MLAKLSSSRCLSKKEDCRRKKATSLIPLPQIKREECKKTRRTCAIARKLSRFALCGCFPRFRKRRRRRCSASSCSGPGTSIGANYREAFRARSKAEFIAKCGDCLREIEETAYWLELLIESKIVATEKLGFRSGDLTIRSSWTRVEAAPATLQS